MEWDGGGSNAAKKPTASAHQGLTMNKKENESLEMKHSGHVSPIPCDLKSGKLTYVR